VVEDDPLVDTVVADRYRIIRKLAEGGMSAIYEAQHIKLMRSFALKSLLPILAHNEEAVQRFQREAELIGGLRHPNVIDISDWVELPDGTPCMVLEFLHGAALQVRLQRGPLPWEAIARIGDQTMSAIALAHRNGITHRDLKPENIFISIDDSGDERVKLLDFGVSKLRGVGRLSGVYRMLGTPSYMSPEQASGQNDLVGNSTDVWAMGAILYEMATQQRAFGADSIEDTLALIQTASPYPIGMLRADANPAFVDLIDRALSRDPERRTQTIEELRSGLRAALEPRNAYRLNTPVAGVPILAPRVARTPTTTPFQSTGQAGGQATAGTMPVQIAAPAANKPDRKRWLVLGAIIALVTLINLAIALAT
jgi:serine/threonine protein kinase